MILKLGFSPCPNDTFIFENLISGATGNDAPQFDVVMADVEELNKKAFAMEFDVCKLSYNAFSRLTDRYQMLPSGSALGFGVGPLLISKRKFSREEVGNLTIAIPGEATTANMLLHFAFPGVKKLKIALFSEIEQMVINGEVDAGVIIHENRFTYEQKGLVKIEDLGDYWERLSGSAIPLGGIAVRRNLREKVKAEVQKHLRRSIEMAFARAETITPFISENAQEMNEEVMKQHIALYVNKYTLDLGQVGKSAVGIFLDKCSEINSDISISEDWLYQPITH